jgi:hypothetical protein
MAVISCPGCKKTFSTHHGLSTHKQYCKHKITAFSKKILEQCNLQLGELSRKRLRLRADPVQDSQARKVEIGGEEESAQEGEVEFEVDVLVSSVLPRINFMVDNNGPFAC